MRKLLREVELRRDVRAGVIFHTFLYTGCRVGDLVALELHNLMLGERACTVVFRFGKGGKQRSVPLPLPPDRLSRSTWRPGHRSRRRRCFSVNEGL